MKKIISLLLSAVIAASLIIVAPIAVGAEDGEVTDVTMLAEYFIENCDNWYTFAKNNTVETMTAELNVRKQDVSREVDRILYQKETEGTLTVEEENEIQGKVSSAFYCDCDKFILYYDAGEYGVYYYDTNEVDFSVQYQRTPNYLIHCSYYRTVLALSGIYFIGYKDNMYSIPDACKKGIVDEDELMNVLADAPDILIFLNGDANEDNLLDINDATQIQQHLSGLITLDRLPEKIADFNDDGILDINDVTVIQMKLAGYKTY